MLFGLSPVGPLFVPIVPPRSPPQEEVPLCYGFGLRSLDDTFLAGDGLNLAHILAGAVELLGYGSEVHFGVGHEIAKDFESPPPIGKTPLGSLLALGPNPILTQCLRHGSVFDSMFFGKFANGDVGVLFDFLW